MSSSPFIRSFPHAEDDGGIAGGDTTALLRGMGRIPPFAGSWRAPAAPPPGNDGIMAARSLENEAQDVAAQPEGARFDEVPDTDIDFLQLVREAETQSQRYSDQINRTAWTQSLRAYHNQHYSGSKYTRPDWRGRSKLFVPKTRAAVHKDNAAVAASLFNSIDAISCLPGNEGDPVQRASAALMEQLVNYRTDRTSGKAAFPWFLVAMGARQDAVLMGICITKQCWKQEYRKTGEEEVYEKDPQTGVFEQKFRETYALDVDRPDMLLIPPENAVIDSSADWTNPAQSSAYFIIKWPMQLDEIRSKQDAPVNPWNDVPEDVLKTAAENGNTSAIRRAREMGLDRLDETQTGTQFQIVWVYENFMRVGGEDYTFYSIGDQHYLTDPRPVREVYPAHYGERPLAMGYGAMESHRINPMAPVESWQPLQHEVNDLRNLRLDATKQNVMPISKIRRGRQIDLDQVRRRSSGSAIIVQEPDDVTWEQPPQIPPSVVEMSRELDLEFDDLSGQQNFGSVQTNNALGKTLGGLKLAAGAANSVQEYDIRVWIQTWAEPALSQIVQLEQFYESDPIVLGLCGQKAQLLQKHGIDKITNDLLEAQVTVRVSVGLGAGDPQTRLQKFQVAASIVAPLLAQTPEFMSGQVQTDWEAICEEVFGSAGYRDGGKRFFKDNGQPKQNPMQDLNIEKLKAEIEKAKKTGNASMLTGLAAVAKVALGRRQLEADVVDALLGHQSEAHRMGFDHGHRLNDQHLAAMDHGHRHGLALAGHKHQIGQDKRSADREDAAAEAEQAGGDAGTGGAAAAARPAPASSAEPSGQPPASSPPSANDALMQLLADGKLEFTRGNDGRISGLKLPQRGTPTRYPMPAA